MMACLNTLKLEIRAIDKVFPKSHERFRTITASVDELICHFIGSNGQKHEITANITVIMILTIFYLSDKHARGL